MINKFQQGGKQLDAVMLFVYGLAEVLQADPKQIIQVALQNPDALKSAVQVYQETQDMQQAAQAFAQAFEQKTQAAKHGAKLNYLKSLKNQCAEDEELVYYKKGGAVECGCVKKEQQGGKTPQKNTKPVDKFKKDQQKKTEKLKPENTPKLPNGKYPSYWTPEERGKWERLYGNNLEGAGSVENKGYGKNKCGGTIKKFKKHQLGGSLNDIPFMQTGTPKGGLPTAPKAEDRYKNGFRKTNGDPYVDHKIKFSGSNVKAVIADTPYNIIPAAITQQITKDGDTIYTETPEYKRFSFRLFPVKRNASFLNPKGNEYEILKRRFNTAWNLAK